jgi:signal transduction histidine kinase
MGKADYIVLMILTTLIIFVFIGGIIIFFFQYHKRKLVHEREKAILNEQHMQDLLYTKQEIQKQTLADIGREIHDNVGQRLTLASIYANHLAFEGQYPQINMQVSAISNILNESLAELRSLSRSLTNASAEFTDLKDLVDNECKRVNAMNVCRVDCTFANANFKISATIKTFILRIIQEFIQNSLKHANCSLVRLDLNYDPTGLHIHAADNGQGFDLNGYSDAENKGIGLVNMKKRAELIGADFTIASKPKEGTTLNILIPADKLNAS